MPPISVGNGECVPTLTRLTAVIREGDFRLSNTAIKLCPAKGVDADEDEAEDKVEGQVG